MYRYVEMIIFRRIINEYKKRQKAKELLQFNCYCLLYRQFTSTDKSSTGCAFIRQLAGSSRRRDFAIQKLKVFHKLKRAKSRLTQ